MTLTRVILAGLLLAGCGQEDAPSPTPSGPIPVSVVIARRGEVAQTGVASGKIETALEVEIRSRVNGTLLAVGHKEGDPVKAGDLLFRIDSAPYKAALERAQATLRDETARVAAARAEVDRQAKLQAVGSATLRVAEEAAQSAEAARSAAAEKVRLAELDLGSCEIRSPINGVAGRSLRPEGALISSGGLLTVIAQTGVVCVRFGLSEPEFYRLYNSRAAAAASAAVRIQLPNDDLHPAVGKVDFAAAEVDGKLGSVQFRGIFDNTDGSLVAGQVVRVHVSGLKVPGFLVPQSALVQSATGRGVLVVVGGKLEAREVALGDVTGDAISILSGLAEGDQVVIDPPQKFRVGTTVVPQVVSSAAK